MLGCGLFYSHSEGTLRHGVLKHFTYCSIVSKLDLSQDTFSPWPNYVRVGGVRGGSLDGSDGSVGQGRSFLEKWSWRRASLVLHV